MVYRYGFRKSRRTFRRRFSGRRRTFARRNFGRRFSKSTAVSQYQGGTRFLGFRRRKPGLRRWKNMLLRNTSHLSHYRSSSCTETTLTTNANRALGEVVTLFPLFISTTGFWVAAGGAVDLDEGVTLGPFAGDIILRGGKIGVNFAVASTVTQVLSIRVWVMHTVNTPDLTIVDGDRAYGWDPTLTADVATKFGRPVMFREAMLNGNSQFFTVEYRINPSKIDQSNFTDGSSQFCFVVQATNLSSDDAVAVSVNRYHNVSFTGDQFQADT